MIERVNEPLNGVAKDKKYQFKKKNSLDFNSHAYLMKMGNSWDTLESCKISRNRSSHKLILKGK